MVLHLIVLAVLNIMKIIRLFCLGFGLFLAVLCDGSSVPNGWAAGNDPSLEKPFIKQFSDFYRYTERRAVTPLNFTGEDGKIRTLDDYKGKLVLYHFWATWCAPCLEELPQLSALHDRMKDRDDFAIVPISLDYNPDILKISEFMKKHKAESLPVLIVPPGEGGWDSLTGFALPTTFIVGPDGAILYKLIGDGKWMSPVSLDFLDYLLTNQTK